VGRHRIVTLKSNEGRQEIENERPISAFANAEAANKWGRIPLGISEILPMRQIMTLPT